MNNTYFWLRNIFIRHLFEVFLSIFLIGAFPPMLAESFHGMYFLLFSLFSIPSLISIELCGRASLHLFQFFFPSPLSKLKVIEVIPLPRLFPFSQESSSCINVFLVRKPPSFLQTVCGCVVFFQFRPSSFNHFQGRSSHHVRSQTTILYEGAITRELVMKNIACIGLRFLVRDISYCLQLLPA